MCDFYLSSDLKQKVYRNISCTLQVLQIELWNVILEITEGKIPNVCHRIYCQCKIMFLNVRGHHYSRVRKVISFITFFYKRGFPDFVHHLYFNKIYISEAGSSSVFR
jgi:hypothetical protein